MISFKVANVWNLGETVHVIGTVENGSIGPGATLLDSTDDSLVLNVKSVALGGGANLPPGTVTLVVEKLPCPANILTGRILHKR
jgi:hypothetical protein